ncbi:hypothetical protein ACCT19_38760, partial [Rhizobium ruizarguesonis]
VAMTRHREGVQLYAGLDAFKTERALTEALSRSGVKETTLDYTHDFANRRGMEDQRGQGESDVASQGISFRISSGRRRMVSALRSADCRSMR